VGKLPNVDGFRGCIPTGVAYAHFTTISSVIVYIGIGDRLQSRQV